MRRVHIAAKLRHWAMACCAIAAFLTLVFGAPIGTSPAGASRPAARQTVLSDLCHLAIKPELDALSVTGHCRFSHGASTAYYDHAKVSGADWAPKFPPGGEYLLIEVWTGPPSLRARFEALFKQAMPAGSQVSLGSWGRQYTSSVASLVAAWLGGAGLWITTDHNALHSRLAPGTGARLFSLATAVADQVERVFPSKRRSRLGRVGGTAFHI
ncbi:MAG: hypothetical protein ACLQVK_17225 [Acidimicrobiales bacterium]